jgi:hypothetical protein
MRAEFIARPGLANLILRRIRSDLDGFDLCPRCAVRPIRVKNAGLCHVCHLNDLTERLIEAQSEQAARRSYDAVKSAGYRERQA